MDAPVLVVRAGRDEVVRTDRTHLLVEALSDPVVVSYPDADHNNLSDDPGYWPSISTFLDGQPDHRHDRAPTRSISLHRAAGRWREVIASGSSVAPVGPLPEGATDPGDDVARVRRTPIASVRWDGPAGRLARAAGRAAPRRVPGTSCGVTR